VTTASLRLSRPFAALVAGSIGALLALASSDSALAAQRLTCSRALQACGKQRICQTRFQACMETGCWAVWRVRRCGYERR
jgi:hypothetical protein